MKALSTARRSVEILSQMAPTAGAVVSVRRAEHVEGDEGWIEVLFSLHDRVLTLYESFVGWYFSCHFPLKKSGQRGMRSQ